MVRSIAALLVLIFCLVGINACKKIPFDYRNRFTGPWHFEVRLGSNGYESRDGRIYYKGAGNEVFIEYGPNEFITVPVDENGNVGTTSGSNPVYGRISKDTMFCKCLVNMTGTR